MKKTASLSLITILFLLGSCAPRIVTSISKNYPLLDIAEEVRVIELNETLPLKSELLGEVKIGDAGFTNKCDLATVLTIAKLEARKVGGNAIKIVSHQTPDFVSSCHRISANIYKVTSFDVATTVSTESGDSAVTAALVKDSIEITKLKSGHKYTYKGETLTMNRLGELLNNNTTSAKYFSKAKGNAGLLQVTSYLGGALIGYPIGTMLGGGKPLWKLAAVGCGILVISIPIVSSVNANLLKAVNAYNQESALTKKDNFFDVKLGLNQSGVALIMHF